MNASYRRGEITYDFIDRDYRFKATHLEEPHGDALIEIFKGDKLVKKFLFPAYKIYNIPAHKDDIIDGIEQESNEGLLIAGSYGLGGNCYAEGGE